MEIKTILRRSRRDFTALYKCEHCGHEEEKGGYDDDNFHINVIPNMTCGECGKTAGEDYQARQTKYEPWEIV